MNYVRVWWWLALLAALGARADGTAADANATYIDRLHDSLSSTLTSWSDTLDEALAKALGGEGERGRDANGTSLQRERRDTDTFFQTRKYLAETSGTYIRVRGAASLSSLSRDETRLSVRLHLPLSKVRRRLRFFVEDLDDRNAGDLFRRTPSAQQAATLGDTEPKFGLNYFAPRAFGIYSKYSLGFSGLHPYVRGRYGRVFEAGAWIVEPVETLQYSEKYDFSESTDLYVDTEPRAGELFRIRLYRGTRAHRDGMVYGAGVSYAWRFSRHTGVRLVQSFAGDTDYTYTPPGENSSRKFSGIH
ncbi:hypothetical protein, partial [Hydrogenimonas sp.]